MTDPILACAMCLGGADGEMAIAANAAIGLMLVFVALVLGSFGGFIFYLSRKARAVATEDAHFDALHGSSHIEF